MQQIEQQETPPGSERKSYRSKFGPRSEIGGSRKSIILNDQSLFAKRKNLGSEYSESAFGGFAAKPTDRKILYRVSKKIYSPEEIQFIRERVLSNRKGSAKKFFHFCTSILMIILIFAMNGVLLWRISEQWLNKYEVNLASVDIQDPSVSNYASTVSVIRYFLYDNSSGDIIFINGEAAIPYSTAYTNIETACGNTNAHIGTEPVIKTIKDSTDSPFKLTYDLLFIIIMYTCMGYIIFRTWKPLKIYRIPLIIRTNNLSPWSYKQRFKLCAFGIFLILSSFFTRYNMYDYSQKCLYCFTGYS